MDQRKKMLDLVSGTEKSSVVSPHSQKLGISGNQNVEDDFSFTPQKTKESLPTQSKEEELNILEKRKDIVNFFDGLTCSLRLLSLGKKLANFTNVSAQVEILTKRKFSHKDLAQIKYLLPEAIKVEKIVVHYQKTLCVKPDLKVTLLHEVIEKQEEESDFVALRRVFATRLTSFFSKHPEANDIPEATLSDSIDEPRSTSSESEKAVTAEETENNNTLLTSPGPEKEEIKVVEVKKFSPSSSKSVIVNNQDIEDQQSKEGLDLCSGSTNDSSIGIIPPSNSLFSPCKSPIQILGSSDSFMVETPAQLTPMGLMPTSDDKPKNNIDSQSESCNKPAKRSLKFTDLEGDESDIAQTTKCETMISEDTKSKIEIPSLVRMIHLIFQSVNFSPMTKEELVYKIIINLDTVEKGEEVEKQIERLEKLVPDWICRKSSSSGDTLYNIRKSSDLNAIQESLDSSSQASDYQKLSEGMQLITVIAEV